RRGSAGWEVWFMGPRIRDGSPVGRRRRRAVLEALEARQLLTTVPAVLVDSASTADSRGVTIEYDVNTPPDATHPLNFGIFRSADNQYSAEDSAVGDEAIVAPGAGTPTLDDLGQVAASAGHHRLTISLPDGLPPDPKRPYVLAVANPAAALASGDLA